MDKKSRDFVMGKLYLKNKDYRMAEKSFTEYLSVNPEDYQALKMLAQVQEQLNDTAKAFDFYQRCYLSQPDRSGVLLDICRLLLFNDPNLEHVDKKKWLRLAEQAFPTNPIIKSLRESLPNGQDSQSSKVTFTSVVMEKLTVLEDLFRNFEDRFTSIEDRLKSIEEMLRQKEVKLPTESKPEVVVPSIESIGKLNSQPKPEGLNLFAESMKSLNLENKPEATNPSPGSLGKLNFAAKTEATKPSADGLAKLSFDTKTEAAKPFPETLGKLSFETKSDVFKPFNAGLGKLSFETKPELVKPVAENSGNLSFGACSGLTKPFAETFGKLGLDTQPDAIKPFSETLGKLSFEPKAEGLNLFAESLKKLNLPTESSWATPPKPANENEEGNVDGDNDDDGVVPTEELPIENTCDMRPIEIKTGEEDEDVVFKHRCKLFRFRDKEYKERGLGDIKVLRHKETGKGRLIMRREMINLVCLNCWSCQNIERLRETQIRFAGLDASDGDAELTVFLVKFKTPELTDEFLKHLKDLFKDE